MKRFRLSVMVTIFVFFLVAQPSFVCGKSAQSEDNYKVIAQAGQADIKPAREEPKQTDKENRESFRADMKKAVQDLDKEIATLSKKVKKEGSKAKSEAKESWKDLRAKQEVAKKKVKELSAAGEGAWDKVKSETNNAVKEARKAYEKALSYFK